MKPVAVLGGGISGLSAAFYLKKAGVPYLLFEKSTPGGAIRSHDLEGTTTDLGPNTLRDRDGTLTEMISELGLDEQILPISEAFKTRNIVRNGKLHALKPSPGSFLGSSVMSAKGKLRLFKEPFIQAGTESFGDESIASFLERRVGKEAVEALVDPVLSGIYAGDIRKMSKQEILSTLTRYEQKYGSIVKGFLKEKKTNKVKPSVLNFSGGIQTLTDRLAKECAESLILSEVRHIEYSNDSYILHTSDKTFSCKAVLSCVPAYVLAQLVKEMDTLLPDYLNEIRYTPIMTTQVLFQKDQLTKEHDGFGFLVPRSEGYRLLGAIWKSNIFPQHTSEDLFHMNILSGGAHDEFGPEMMQEVEEQVIREAKKLMGIQADPVRVYSFLWERGIPQFHVGYGRTRQALSFFSSQHPHFIVGGNYVWGVSVPDCVKGAKKSVNEHFGVQNS